MTAGASTRTRAGRLRLISRLDLARHGVDLLHSKEEALQREGVRLEAHVSRTKYQWDLCCSGATTSLLRSRALGASAELASLVTQSRATAAVTPHWETSMGISYPGVIDVTPGPEPTLTSTAALRPTVDAYVLALQAGADHAATTEALRRLSTELGATRRRRRAIEQRLIPLLVTQLHALDLHLDEQDRDEATRVHIAVVQREASQS